MKHGRYALPASLVSFAIANGLKCTWCGEDVDLTASIQHPRSPTREHLKPHSLGGSTMGLALAHKRCNARRGTIEESAFRRLLKGETCTAHEMWPHLFPELKESEEK